MKTFYANISNVLIEGIIELQNKKEVEKWTLYDNRYVDIGNLCL